MHTALDIDTALRAFELREDIRILYACATGAHGWGLAAPDSPEEVQCVYIKTQDWYLSIEDQPEACESTCERGGIHLVGWDIRKALRHFRRSDGAVFEWLQSPEIYCDRGPLREQLLRAAPDFFCPQAGLTYYLQLAEAQFAEIKVKGRPEVGLLILLNGLRALLSTAWIAEFGVVPPANFAKLLHVLKGKTAYDALLEEAETWLELRRQTCHTVTVPLTPSAENFMAEQLQTGRLLAARLPRRWPDRHRLDHLFRQVLHQTIG